MRRSLRSPSSNKKFLDPAVLEEAARQVISLAARNHIRVALVGGLALQHYGSHRLTGDVDIVASAPLPGVPKLKTLTFGGEGTRAPNGVPVCVIRRRDAYHRLYRAALTHAVPLHGFPTVPLEYIAAMKLVAGRSKDMVDLEFMISSGRLNLGRARKIIHAYVGGEFAVDTFNAIVMETEWKKRAGKL
jgi:hypothetical protein